MLTPSNPHFYMVKLEFRGECIIFLFMFKNIDCEYPLEPPHRGGSNEYPQSMFRTASSMQVLASTYNLCFEQIYEKIRIFFWNFFYF